MTAHLEIVPADQAIEAGIDGVDEQGAAYFREMELLVESGLTPMQVIQGATSLNAERQER